MIVNILGENMPSLQESAEAMSEGDIDKALQAFFQKRLSSLEDEGEIAKTKRYAELHQKLPIEEKRKMYQNLIGRLQQEAQSANSKPCCRIS